MKTNHTDITIVLDRSGSMHSVAADTIGGFNKFLADQKSAPGTANLTLHQFDHAFETLIDGKDIQSAEDLTSSTFVPRGNTALLDAIGRAVTATGVRLAASPADKVVFVIITDGHENASKEFNLTKVNEMISHQKDKYSWEFVFLGANQDAIAAGQALGVNASSSMTYASNAMGTQSAFLSTSANLRNMRSGDAETMDFCAADYKAQAEAGATP
jgi:hypothetical protein